MECQGSTSLGKMQVLTKINKIDEFSKCLNDLWKIVVRKREILLRIFHRVLKIKSKAKRENKCCRRQTDGKRSGLRLFI